MSALLRFLVSLVTGLTLLMACSDDEDPASDAPPAVEPITVTLYDADFSISAAGDLRVVETLTLDVPTDDRHGIHRTFEATAVEGFDATLDESETPVAVSVEDGTRRFAIGDPDQTLSVGEHVVRMEYGVADVLTRDRGARVRQFDWPLVPGEWEMDIEAADLTVQLPNAASQAECVIGADDPCDVSGVGTTTLVITTDTLEDHTPVWILALLTGA